MSSRPSLSELAGAVREWISEELVPQLDGDRAYPARIAVRVLEIIAREIELSDRLQRHERSRLVALLGYDAELGQLNADLCARIAAGSIDHSDPRLLDHLRLAALEKLAIDNPRYWSYRSVAARVHFSPETGAIASHTGEI